MSVTFNEIRIFIFDFDGVLTNNLVHLDKDGNEWVSCSRADGLAFDVLRKQNKPAWILSTEKNPVVSARANKLKIPVMQGIPDKVQALHEISRQTGIELQHFLFVGNDVNDLKAMNICGYSACPSDSHPDVLKTATFNLATSGGQGVVRELLEGVFKLNFVEILY